jgi:hypothetical protein
LPEYLERQAKIEQAFGSHEDVFCNAFGCAVSEDGNHVGLVLRRPDGSFCQGSFRLEFFMQVVFAEIMRGLETAKLRSEPGAGHA